jgi:hypothetical protein
LNLELETLEMSLVEYPSSEEEEIEDKKPKKQKVEEKKTPLPALDEFFTDNGGNGVKSVDKGSGESKAEKMKTDKVLTPPQLW